MGRYQFVSPGAAAGDSIVDVLTQRRAEARQKMLDEVSKQNIQSEMDYRKSQSDSMAEERAANAEWRKGQASELQSKADQRKQWRGSIDTYMTSPEFSGLPAQTQQAFKLASLSPDDDLLRAVITNLTSASKGDEWNPVYDSNGNDTGNWAPKGAHFLPKESSGQDDWFPVFNSNGQDTGNWAPKGAHFLQNEPQGSAASQANLYYIDVPDPNDPTGTKTIKEGHWLRPGEQPSKKNLFQGGVAHKGNLPPIKPVPLYNEQAYGRYKTALQATGANAAQTRASSMNDLINSISDPLIKKDVQDVLNDPRMQFMPADQLASLGVIHGEGATNPEEHVSKVLGLLRLIRGK